VSDRI